MNGRMDFDRMEQRRNKNNEYSETNILKRDRKYSQKMVMGNSNGTHLQA